jgi:type I restriction enzyme S subunit
MEKQQSKKPLIRFPEFKDAWEHKQLNELLSEAKKRNEDLKYGKDEVLSVSGELGIVNQIEHLGRSYAGVSVHQYHVVEVGDIVYTKSPLKANPFGIIKLNKGKAGIVSTLYAVYKVNQQTAYGPFIDYYFSLDANTNRYLRPLVKKGAKNDMKINNAYVLHDRIFAPTIPEQKRIASFFTVLDKKIAELKQKKNLLEQYRKGVMQKLFSQELRFKDENGKEFPKWKNFKIGDIASLIKDGTHGTHKDSTIGNYYLLSAKNVVDGTIRIEESDRKISKEDFDLIYKNYNLKNDDILLTIVGTIGRTAMWNDNIKNVAFQRSVAFLRFEKHLPEFIYQLFNQEQFQLELLKRQVVSAQPGIYLGDLAKIKINIPNIEEQSKIANFLRTIDDKITRTNSQLEETKRFKKGLLQNMFI